MKKAKIVTKRCGICNKPVNPEDDTIFIVANLTGLAAPHHAECIKEHLERIMKGGEQE